MAKKTKKTEVLDARDIATELYEVRRAKNELLQEEKKLSTQLKTLLKEGDDSQDLFEITIARSISITDNEKAVKWAEAKYPHILTVDTKAAKAILQRALTPLPDGFEVKETERLTQVGHNDEE